MTEAATLETLDIGRLLELLPHRYPFLLIDRVVNVNSDESATGIKNVTFNEPCFTGHFPEKPIMPGVLIIEAMAQTAGVICLHKLGGNGRAEVFFLTIDNAKFRRPVVPGDRLEIHVRKLRQRGGIYKYACEATVDGVKVSEAEVSAAVSFPENG